MSALPRRQQGLVVTALLAVVAAIGGAALLLSSSQASEVDLTSAKFVPADAVVYIGINTDLSSSQWVAAFKLAKRLGSEDPEKELKDAAEANTGASWEREVVPFLGGDAAFYMKSLGFPGEGFKGGAAMKCKDAGAALEVLVQKSSGSPERRSYNGVPYIADDDTNEYAATVGDHLLVATDEDSLKEMIDAGKGKTKSLAEADDFRELRDAVTKSFIGFYYIDASRFLDDTPFGDDILKQAIGRTTGQDLVLKPTAGAILANGEGFSFQAASKPEKASDWPGTQARTSRFASMVPGETMVFASTAGVAQAWEQSMTPEVRKQLDETLAAQDMGPRSLDEALKEAGREFGLGSVEELIRVLTGELAIAAWQDEGETADAVFLAEVRNEAEARDLLAKMAASEAGGSSRPGELAGVPVTLVTAADGEETAFVVRDGYVAVGTVRGVEAVLKKPAKSLADSAIYQRAAKALPTSLGSFLFVDIQRMLASELGTAEFGLGADAMEGLIFNMVEEAGLARLAGTLTIAK